MKRLVVVEMSIGERDILWETTGDIPGEPGAPGPRCHHRVAFDGLGGGITPAVAEEIAAAWPRKVRYFFSKRTASVVVPDFCTVQGGSESSTLVAWVLSSGRLRPWRAWATESDGPIVRVVSAPLPTGEFPWDGEYDRRRAAAMTQMFGAGGARPLNAR